MHAKYSTGFEITEMNAKLMCVVHILQCQRFRRKKIPYVMECLLAYQRA